MLFRVRAADSHRLSYVVPNLALGRSSSSPLQGLALVGRTSNKKIRIDVQYLQLAQ
jgi:hypothetical protein